MKFIHMADMHFDIPFTVLNNRNKLGDKRRLEQREALKKVINYIKENNIEYLFISGDLYEQEYIRESTIKYINNLFKEIPQTKIYIAPGNHDPYIKNSYYAIYNWNDNVKIFNQNVEKIENEDVDIYGFGFNNFEMNKNQLENINIENKNKINILITHGDLTESIYNPMNINILKNKGFDYVALGHVHKRDDSTNIVYPGSLISLGFDELGQHGMIVGEINNNNLIKKFIPIDDREFIEKEINVDNIFSEEELIEKINNIEENNNLYKIILTGNRNFPININIKLLKNNIIKIKNNTKIKIEIRENNYSLKGIFIKKLNEKKENKEINEDTYEKILELGMQVLEKNNK